MRAPRGPWRLPSGPGTLPEAVCEALTAHRDEAFVAWHEASPAECAYLRSIATRPDGATS